MKVKRMREVRKRMTSSEENSSEKQNNKDNDNENKQNDDEGTNPNNLDGASVIKEVMKERIVTMATLGDSGVMVEMVIALVVEGDGSSIDT
jgi:hypothetical protein